MEVKCLVQDASVCAGIREGGIVKPHGGRKYCHPSDVDKVIRILESGIAND